MENFFPLEKREIIEYLKASKNKGYWKFEGIDWKKQTEITGAGSLLIRSWTRILIFGVKTDISFLSKLKTVKYLWHLFYSFWFSTYYVNLNIIPSIYIVLKD